MLSHIEMFLPVEPLPTLLSLCCTKGVLADQLFATKQHHLVAASITASCGNITEIPQTAKK